MTNDVRGRLFELIVINRCRSVKVRVKPVLTTEGRRFKMPECKHVTRFRSQDLPTDMVKDGIYIPRSVTFPAIDFIWKQDLTVWGVQVHVAAHRDVLANFTSMCRTAKWLDQFKHIYLLYLSPEEKVKKLAERNQPSTGVRASSRVPSKTAKVPLMPVVILASRGDLTCLEGLNWPDGCSIPPKIDTDENSA